MCVCCLLRSSSSGTCSHRFNQWMDCISTWGAAKVTSLTHTIPTNYYRDWSLYIYMHVESMKNENAFVTRRMRDVNQNTTQFIYCIWWIYARLSWRLQYCGRRPQFHSRQSHLAKCRLIFHSCSSVCSLYFISFVRTTWLTPPPYMGETLAGETLSRKTRNNTLNVIVLLNLLPDCDANSAQIQQQGVKEVL